MEETVMPLGPNYRVPYRRRREGKTDYKARRALVLSKIPRFIVRGSLKHMTVQIVEARSEGDRVITAANSRELIKTFGWKGSCSNLPSAYLTGFLCGLRAVGKGVKRAILDIGLFSPTKGSRIFAALKGVMDAGVEIPCEKEKLPDENRVSGQHIAEYAKQLSAGEQTAYQKQFSRYLKENLQPEQLPTHFSETKEKIAESFKPKEEKKKEPEAKAKPKGKPKARAKPKTARKPRKKKTEEKKE
ncbi:MAG TPA: 50S ribosomal protein L18 [Candidatus Krumholzibacteriaceae bacterium]|nr:50S ribosomal protein L18 [Candidatus Krumholzibacteriaceae bacterium]